MVGRSPDATPRADSAHSLTPWRLGAEGKCLLEASGAFHAWRTPDGLAPHHAVAAELLGVSSWVLDGIVATDGTLEPTATGPGIDIDTLKSRAAPQAESLGMRFIKVRHSGKAEAPS